MRFVWRQTGVLAVAMMLSACALPDIDVLRVAPRPTLALLGGDVTAAGPEHYCVDRNASAPRDGFALLASCLNVAGTESGPLINGIITVQAGAAGTAAVAESGDDLVAFLLTAQGAATLGGGDAKVKTAKALNDRVIVHFSDSAAPAIVGLQGEEWRGFIDVNGRLTTISVRGLAAFPLSNSAGLALLDMTLDAVEAANRPVVSVAG